MFKCELQCEFLIVSVKTVQRIQYTSGHQLLFASTRHDCVLPLPALHVVLSERNKVIVYETPETSILEDVVHRDN